MTNPCFKDGYELLDVYPTLEESVVRLNKIHLYRISCPYSLIINSSYDQDEVRFNLGFTSTTRLSSDRLAPHMPAFSLFGTYKAWSVFPKTLSTATTYP